METCDWIPTHTIISSIPFDYWRLSLGKGGEIGDGIFKIMEPFEIIFLSFQTFG